MEPSQYTATAVPIAAQVCLNCKARKRRCNKALPKCELCTRLLMKCDYGNSNITTVVSLGLSGNVVNEWKKINELNCEVPDWKASSTFLATFSTRYLSSVDGTAASYALHTATTNEVLRIISSTGEPVEGVIERYMRCIGVWLKCISYERLMKRMQTIQSDPSSDLAVLILVLYLIVQMPGQGSMQTPAYFTTKALLDPILSSGKASLENVQASLLVALYEHGHGLLEPAQVTLASCGRLGMKVMGRKRRTGAPDLQNTEEGRLWWSILILDRYMSAGLPPDELNFAAGHSNHKLFSLPLPIEELGQNPDPSLTIEYLCGPTDGTRKFLTPFVASAIAADLLGQVLESKDLRNLAKFKRLDRALQALAMDLIRQAGEVCAKSCAAISMNLIGLLILHKSRYYWIRDEEGELSPQTTASIMSIKSIVRICGDIIERFNSRVHFIDFNAFPIPAAYAGYEAALTHIEFAGDDFNTPEWNDGINLIMAGLGNFGKRWTIAQRYMKQIDDATTAKRVQYSALTLLDSQAVDLRS